jgi:hypothetical protein
MYAMGMRAIIKYEVCARSLKFADLPAESLRSCTHTCDVSPTLLCACARAHDEKKGRRKDNAKRRS